MTIDIRRADTRNHTQIGWLDSRHSFGFGQHYDRANTNHGLLLVSNDDVVAPGRGFDTHPHRDMEIITWVLEGTLEHKDTLDNHDVIYPGLAQRMTAGRGIWHSEKNPSTTDNVRLVQMWVLPDIEAVDPGYQQLDVNAELDKGGLITVASGTGADAAISIQQQNAELLVGRLRPDEVVAVPDDQFVHLFVATGWVDLAAVGSLGEGDAVRFTSAGSPILTAGPEGAEILIWTSHA